MGNDIYKVCSCKEQNLENQGDTNLAKVIPRAGISHVSSSLLSESTLQSSFNVSLFNHCHNDSMSKKFRKVSFTDKKEEQWSSVKTISAKEGKYTGEFKNGKKEGKGRIEYNSGEIKSYEGGWKKDKPDGFGKEIYINGAFYEGHFLKGLKNGRGKLIIPSVGRYVGNFVDNEIEGYGEYKWSNDREYKGEWKANCIEGFGLLIEGGKEHFGEFAQNKKNGFGITFYRETKVKLIANWYNDTICGSLAVIIDGKDNENVVSISNNCIKKLYALNEIKEFGVKDSCEFKNLIVFYKANLDKFNQ